MKSILIFLAIIAYARTAQVPLEVEPRLGEDAAKKFFEDVRDQMPCGFPGLGIPPLAPLKIPHREVNVDLPALKMRGSVDNFRLYGLNDYEVADLKINAILSKVQFRFVFKNVHVDTLYDLNVILKKAGFTVKMIGAGPAKFAIKDMHITGLIKYSLGILTGKLKLKTLEIRTHIGEVESQIEGIFGNGVVNEKMNEVLAEAVELAVNENENEITETIESIAMPMVNDVLNQFTLAEMIGAITGGGDDGEKEVCIPPIDN